MSSLRKHKTPVESQQVRKTLAELFCMWVRFKAVCTRVCIFHEAMVFVIASQLRKQFLMLTNFGTLIDQQSVGLFMFLKSTNC